MFSTPHDADGFDEAVRTHIEVLRPRFPATTTYVGFEELVRTWDAAMMGTAADAILFVGTRPPLLADRATAMVTPAQMIQLTTSRGHDTAGRTAAVRLIGCSDPAALRQSSHLLVADDVAMSATTLHAVLSSGLIRPDATVCVRIAFATVPALRRLRAEFPTAGIRAERVLDFAPVTEGTAIFLSALFFGILRGRPFLCQRKLLRPFFGADLAALHELRDLVRRLLPEVPVLSPRTAVTHDPD
ncbi:MAG: hypothetical protein ACRDSZ_01285 [Pseudonocardiaceae bacterium]